MPNNKDKFKPKRSERVRVNQLCYLCKMDCKEEFPMTTCEFYEKGLTCAEYWRFIKENNVNLRKLCDKYGVKLTILLNMLEGRQNFSYKYRKILDTRVYELQTYEAYLEEFDGKN